MENHEKLKLLFSTLVVYRHNIHVLHWKIKGTDFNDKHSLAEDYVNQLSKYIDEVAEMLLMLNENPFGLNEIVDRAKESDEELVYLTGEKNYTNTEMFKYIGDMFESLMKIYEDAKEEVPEDIQSKLDEHIYYFRLENNYKNKRRLM